MAIKTDYTLTIDGKTVRLIGDATVIENFFPAAVVSAVSAPVQNVITFRGGSYRKYPGGPSRSRSGGTRLVVTEAPSKGNTLPGRPFTCEVPGISESGKPITIARQLTLVGSYSVLKNAARAGATVGFTLRSPNGKPSLIDAN